MYSMTDANSVVPEEVLKILDDDILEHKKFKKIAEKIKKSELPPPKIVWIVNFPLVDIIAAFAGIASLFGAYLQTIGTTHWLSLLYGGSFVLFLGIFGLIKNFIERREMRRVVEDNKTQRNRWFEENKNRKFRKSSSIIIVRGQKKGNYKIEDVEETPDG